MSLAVIVPLVVALVALGQYHWNPVLDLAMTEFRVRDVFTGHTPLIGLPGRIGDQPDQGSHPGPLSFYLIAPVYRVFGQTSWSMELGTVLIHLAAIVSGLALAFRRGGWRMTLVVAALFAVVTRGYGANVLTQPWNPYLPVIPWIVVLLAVWSILEGDSVALVVFVVAGTFCMQTHIPYVGMVGGLGALTLVWLALRTRVSRLRGVDVAMPGLRRWSIVAAVIGVILWLPPVADQLRRTPGNFSKLRDYFGTPPTDAIGLRESAQLLFEHFNVFRVVVEAFNQSGYFKSTALTISGSAVPGAIVLLSWALTALQAWRLRVRALIHLHAIVAACLVLATVSMSRIFGKVWYYLMFWLWGVVLFALLAMAWTVAESVRRRLPERSLEVRRGVTYGAAALLVVSTVAFSWSGVHAEPPENYLSEPLDDLVGPTAQALTDGVGAATGRDGRYSVTWSDVAVFGSQGYGLLNELDRRGFHVGSAPYFYTTSTPYRVVDPATATAVVHFANGAYIDEWAAKPDTVQVAFTDPRSPEDTARYERLRDDVIARLRDAGLDELVDGLDRNLFGVQLDDRVSDATNRLIDQMIEIGQPTAVFIAPPGVG